MAFIPAYVINTDGTTQPQGTETTITAITGAAAVSNTFTTPIQDDGSTNPRGLHDTIAVLMPTLTIVSNTFKAAFSFDGITPPFGLGTKISALAPSTSSGGGSTTAVGYAT